jgi:polyferredoxin
LCPLGGFLAVLDRLHLLNRLKRRPECGSPCRLCERSCPVRAIAPSGKIVTAECFQCLDCQVEYYDVKRCPPLVQAVKLRNANRPVTVSVRNA